MGRSSDPGRERRRSGAGEAAVTAVQSRVGFGRGRFPVETIGVSSLAAREGAMPGVNIGDARPMLSTGSGRNRRV